MTGVVSTYLEVTDRGARLFEEVENFRVEIPEKLQLLLELLDASENEIATMHEAWRRLKESSERKRRHARKPSGQDTDRSTPAIPWYTRLPRRAWVALLCVAVAAAVVYLIPRESSSSTGLPPGYVPLDQSKVAPKPQPRAASPACDGRKSVGHQFPDAHIGDVWVLVTSSTGTLTRSEIDIQWARCTGTRSSWLTLATALAAER